MKTKPKPEAEKSIEALKQPLSSLSVEDYHKKWDGITASDNKLVEEFTFEHSKTLHVLRIALDDYFENGKRPVNDRFIVGKTPLVLQKTGSDLTDVTVPVSVVKKAVETHGLSQKEIYETLAHIYNPVLIFDSDKKATENKVESKLVLTDIFKDEKPLALAVNVNSDVKLKDSNISVEVQDIRSVHDRTVIAKNGIDLIQKWANDGLCRYVDDKKITDWGTIARVYFPIEVLQSDNNKILSKSELVNSQQAQKNQHRNIAFETSKEKNMTELKTYHTLKEEDVKNLEIISDEDFSDIVDSIILNDYKNIPNTIRLPNINSELAEKLGLKKDSAFIMKKSATHIRPDRKGSYGQALDTEEYRMIPKVMRDAMFALVDKRVKNFQILFDDKNDIKKINKIVFNKDKLGNYLVTIGKVGRQNSISEKENIVVGVGVAPTISDLRFPKGQPATRLRPSPTTVNSNIAQNKEKSTSIQKNQPVLKYEDKIGKDNLEKIKKHFEKNVAGGTDIFKSLNMSENRIPEKGILNLIKKNLMKCWQILKN
ncbi:MAG: hypothetical protein ACI4LX_01485 [Treponema sp.]